MEKTTTANVNGIKIQLFDVIEQQSALQARLQQMEQTKNDLVKQLSDARQAEAEAQGKPAPKPKKRREVEDDYEDEDA